MALSKTTMATMRLAELNTAYPDIPMSGEIYNEMMKYFEADSSGIIKEFTTNSVVQPGTFSNSGGSLGGTGKVS
jgi:hypothetical protein